MIISLVLEIIGLLAVFLEFWLPGMAMGMIGGSLIGSSLFLAFLVDWRWGAVLTQFGIVALIVVIRFALKGLSRKKMCLANDQENYKGCSFKEGCLGKEGEVVQDLKPSGTIEIEGELFQALSKGQYLKRGTKITVIGGEGFHLIVR